MKICFISDTHGFHSELKLPKDIDLLIHCGDLGMRGTETEILNFIKWFNSLQVPHKVFIAGNHDFWLEMTRDENVRYYLEPGVHYLNDSGVTIEGINIWGSPVQPWFHNWAFNRERGAEIKKHWDLIPSDIDILVTHGPPEGILDLTTNFDVVGCEDLLEAVIRIKPKIHAFGHIHEMYGQRLLGSTRFVNASVLDHRYRLVNDVIVLDYP